MTELPKGTKFDTGKLRMSLVDHGSIDGMMRVLEMGAKKYSVDNWQVLEDPLRRYYDALQRHLFAHQQGEKFDQESGLPHLDHALCCLMFLRWHSLDPKSPANKTRE